MHKGVVAFMNKKKCTLKSNIPCFVILYSVIFLYKVSFSGHMIFSDITVHYQINAKSIVNNSHCHTWYYIYRYIKIYIYIYEYIYTILLQRSSHVINLEH